MLEVTFAYVVATALLLTFKSTRWMGAVAVFILISVAPILSSGLLILSAVVAYVLSGKPRWDVIQKKLPWRD